MNHSTSPRVLFDTDPGADDAIALIWLCALHRAGKLHLAGVTTVGGNIDVEGTTENARRLLALCGCDDVPLGRGDGAGGEQARHVHGEDGLAGLRETLPVVPEPGPSRTAGELLRHTLPDTDALIAVGPLTNIAAAADAWPRDNAPRAVVMGGALKGGNITRHAEFNVHHDPSGWATALEAISPDVVTLDITSRVYVDAGLIGPTRPGALGKFVGDLLGRMCRHAMRRSGAPKFLLHDAVAVAAVAYPDCLSYRPLRLAVETEGVQKGMIMEMASGAPNARVAQRVQRVPLVRTMMRDITELCRALA
ncbi:MAG: nucleoside hydrolase [Pseudomonadota bacterium]